MEEVKEVKAGGFNAEAVTEALRNFLKKEKDALLRDLWRLNASLSAVPHDEVRIDDKAHLVLIHAERLASFSGEDAWKAILECVAEARDASVGENYKVEVGVDGTPRVVGEDGKPLPLPKSDRTQFIPTDEVSRITSMWAPRTTGETSPVDKLFVDLCREAAELIDKCGEKG